MLWILNTHTHVKRLSVAVQVIWLRCCGCFDLPCPSALAVLQTLGPPASPSDGSGGAGSSPPAGVWTTSLVCCLRGFEAAVEGLFAQRECEFQAVSRHGFVLAFLCSHS